MLTLAAWLHTLSPFIWRISGDFGVRWYGAAYLTGFLIAYFLMLHLARRGRIKIPVHRVGDAMVWLIAGTLVGGRLGYVLVYQPSLAMLFMKSPPWWGVLAINQGGMASHGGMIGLMVGAYRISRGWKNPQTGQVEGRCSILHVGDVIALLGPFGIFFGRLANFVNGELLGAIVAKPGTEGPWWTVQYPQELELPVDQVPALNDPVAHAKLDRLLSDVAPGQSFERGVHYLVEHASRYAHELKPILASRHPSQLYQAFAEGIVIGAFLWAAWYKPRKPGVIGALFLIIYGILRIVTEIWRLPDPQFGADGRPWGLSRGQWLSAGMVVLGIGLLWYVVRRPVAKIGGWGQGAQGQTGSTNA